jgi:TetR/AcrR family transcriptional regulator, ethionamide resistance regulator
MPSVTRPSSRHRQRRDEIELRVLDATEEMLRDGARFTQVGVERISRAAGIARSTFYVHFADKGDLLIRLAERATEELFAASDEWWEHDHSGGPARLEEVVGKMIRIYRGHAGVLDAVLEVAGYDESVAAFWRERLGGYADYMRRRLREDARAGRLPPGVDTSATAFIVVWSVERSISEHVRVAGEHEDAAFAEALARSAWLMIFGELPAG